MNGKYFYEIHVNIPKNGYSVAVKSDKSLSEDEIIQLCLEQNKFEEKQDADYVDYVGEINEYDYQTMR